MLQRHLLVPFTYKALFIRAVFLLFLTSPSLGAEGFYDRSSINALTDAVRESPDLAEDERAELQVKLKEATSFLQAAESYTREAQDYRDALENGKSEVAELEAKTQAENAAPTDLESLVGSSPSLQALEAEIKILESEQRAVAEQRDQLLATISEVGRPTSGAQAELTEVKQTLANLPPATQSPSLADKVTSAVTDTHRQALVAKQKLLELRLRASPDLEAVRNARLTYLEAAFLRLQGQLAVLRDAATAARVERIEEEAASTRQLAQGLGQRHSELTVYAERNIDLAKEQRRLTGQIASVRENLSFTREGLRALEEDRALTQRRLEVAGLEAELGDVMQQRLSSLPSPQRMTNATESRNRLIVEISVASIQHDEELHAMAAHDRYREQAFPGYQDWEPDARTAMETLINQRRGLLTATTRAENTLLRMLVDSNEAAEALQKSIRDYEKFLTGNLLWISNYNYLSPTQLVAQLRELLSLRTRPPLLLEIPAALATPKSIVLILFLALCVAIRPRVATMHHQLFGGPLRPRDEHVRLIFKGLLLSAILSVPLALTLYLAGDTLLNAAGTSPQGAAIGHGLKMAAVLIFLFTLLRKLSSRLGLGRRLLKWNSSKLNALRHDLRWADPLIVLAVFFSASATHLSATDQGNALGAAATLIVALSLHFYFVRALKTGLYTSDRLARVLFQVGVALSLAIVVMHLTGHLFAAHLYLRTLGISIVAVLAVLLSTSILKRVLVIYRARLQRKAQKELRNAEQPEEAQADEVEDLETLASLSDAHRQLLSLSRILGLGLVLWFIWEETLPALRLLYEVKLWSVTDSSLPEGQLRDISLATLIIAGTIIAITFLVTKHLPPLVKVLLMEWSNVSIGGRYATGVILQYITIGIGATLSLSLLGWEWSKLQWLVAALGVGIGFGLQEIVANFISGLILLFERPIRPGDIITVSGHDGTVSEINPRATIIESFEGKELMIPNKELITGTVINWSLSSSRLRVVIAVGVAYGSDVKKAMEILVAVARDHPSVVADPAPMATFEEFGDNALTLWLRCFAEQDYLRIWSELRTEINERFNAAGITMAFPQRDVHLDANAPIPVTLVDRQVQKNPD
ncbi:mechanosensitive ion channel domain-containing protein [Motiliproteus sp. SC1-56]|uniref:mechanosensitive ion channel domain-containing protein n=1 Tax=Motiliproteus sp. SC1-56 TaxID=2799565 RepID=UPI001A8CB658|nr:mechanosensitive ion channel domain-containing protein [Motiliproteus sp. SC1-56]